MTPAQANALRALARMFIEAVKEAGNLGAPAGVMYAAVCDKLRLDQFEQIMSGLCGAGYLRKSGDLYFHVRDL